VDGWRGFNSRSSGKDFLSRKSTIPIGKSKERQGMSIVTLLVIIVLVLLAIYLFRRVF
jgi:hypothetical protein